MCGFKCPYSERRRCAGFLLCKKAEKPDVDYNDRKNALDVICVYQAQCTRTGLMENTEDARKCYELKRESLYSVAPAVEAEGAEPEPAGEDKPEPKRKKKKN